MPRTLGSMMLRPGLRHLGSTRGDAKATFLPFVFATSDTALIEVTGGALRVWVDDAPITRPAVATAIINGSFDTDLTGWVGADQPGATSAWGAGGLLSLLGSGFNAAIRRQQVAVATADRGVEHGLRVVIERGEVTLKVGSATGGDDYLSTTLGIGTHSLAFTPTADFHVELSAKTTYATLSTSVSVDVAGAMEIPAPWAETDLGLLRYDQSADVIYLACKGYQPRKIERRGKRSWSLVLYQPDDGPFNRVNLSTTNLTPSALAGDITLTASAPVFKPSNVGSLFRITSVGQQVGGALTGASQFSNEIRVTGTDDQRKFNISITGTWAGTLTLQRSVSEPGAWLDVNTYTANTTVDYDDGLDNQTIYYRLGFDSGDFTSGTATVSLKYSSGGLTGVVRLTAVASETSASAIVLKPLGGTTGSTDWSEGLFSERRGWPSAVALAQGRLWMAGKNRIVASVSDAYESFDPDTEGDSGPINRSIGQGPVDDINWIISLQRIMLGTASAEVSIKSSSFDEPITPTVFSLSFPSTQGSGQVAPVKVDSTGLFVNRSGTRIMELTYNEGTYDYATGNKTVLVPEIGEPGVLKLTVQRMPDTRIHAIRADGTVAVLVTDTAEEVFCWIEVETDGAIEDAATLPGQGEDAVYYLVRRTVNGQTRRYLERWARESDCQGGDWNLQADAFRTVENAIPDDTISGLDHLEGSAVVVWADGRDFSADDPDTGDQSTYTVSSGQITLEEPVSRAVVGLPYRARFKSTKLAYAAQGGTALGRRKRVNQIGLILSNTHALGIKYGPDFDVLDDMPLMEQGEAVGANEIHTHYDLDLMEFAGDWNTDSRLCLEAKAPRPCTVLAAILDITTNA